MPSNSWGAHSFRCHRSGRMIVYCPSQTPSAASGWLLINTNWETSSSSQSRLVGAVDVSCPATYCLLRNCLRVSQRWSS